MRVSVHKGFVQPRVTWPHLERMLGEVGFEPQFVADLRGSCPQVGDLTQENLGRHGVRRQDTERVLDTLGKARDLVQQDGHSPLVRLMGKSRGWVHGTRTKLYLTLLWKHQSRDLGVDPVNIDEYVEHLGVDRRSVNRALRDLDADGFIRLTGYWQRQPRRDRKDPDQTQPINVRGQQIKLRSDLGTGTAYKRPPAGEFFQLGDQLWTEGWMSKLSGQGLAVLLVLLSRYDSHDPTGPIWVATSQVMSWYGFSPRVWHNGVENLTRLKLITTRRVVADTDDASAMNHRKFYSPNGLAHPWLLPDTGDQPPTEPQDMPEGAKVVYLRQVRELNVPLREAVRQLRAVYEIAQNPIEQFEAARELVLLASKHRKTHPHCDQTRSLLRSWAEIHISHAPAYLQAKQRKNPQQPHEGYRYLVELLERDHDYDQALTLATQARQQGWGRTRAAPSSWDNTIQRLDRATRHKAALEHLATLDDPDLYSPTTSSNTQPTTD